MCSRARSLASGLEADDDGSAVQGRTLMTRAEMWRFYSLTHKNPLRGGHGHSWFHQEILKVSSDSSPEPADDKSLLAREVVPVNCQNSKEAAVRCCTHDICTLGEIK